MKCDKCKTEEASVSVAMEQDVSVLGVSKGAPGWVDAKPSHFLCSCCLVDLFEWFGGPKTSDRKGFGFEG